MRRREAIVALCVCLCPAAPAEASPPPFSAHSMVNTCCMPYAQKAQVFAEAKAMGAAYIRLDVVLGGIFHSVFAAHSEPDWKGVDQVAELSRRHGLPVLAVMLGTPAHIAACSEARPDGSLRCAAADSRLFGIYVRRVVERAPDVFRTIEVWNEPDGTWAFDGTPEQYAQMLSATYQSVKCAFPRVTVLTGGAMNLDGRGWYERVFAAPGADAAHSFDIANVHIRGPVARLASGVRRWREFFRRYGHDGPLWVTEAGYPSEDRFQGDERFRGGAPAQARYLRAALPAMVRAGAGQVFVTLRDTWPSEFGLDSPFASEGVIVLDQHEPYGARRKPAFAVIRELVRAGIEIGPENRRATVSGDAIRRGGPLRRWRHGYVAPRAAGRPL
jgi:Glycosyl hydrolase catalytic core